MISPAIAAIAIAALASLAFAGGFAVSDWRSSGEMARLNLDNKVLSASNTQCATDITSVRKRVEEVVNESELLKRSGVQAMETAQPQATKHTLAAITIKAAPIVAEDMQCEAIAREQIEYVNWRRANGS
jgi:hypothetical protein